MADAHDTERSALQRHHLGPHPIIRHYLERMNFRGIVRDCLGGGLHQADRAHVLLNGAVAFSGPTAELLHNPDVLRSYLGR